MKLNSIARLTPRRVLSFHIFQDVKLLKNIIKWVHMNREERWNWRKSTELFDMITTSNNQGLGDKMKSNLGLSSCNKLQERGRPSRILLLPLQ